MRAFWLALLGILATGEANASQWYVDNSVASSGDGTSWANAWKHLSNIVWSSIAGGDTIYVSGGASSGVSQTYLYDDLVVGASGSAGNPITITDGRTQGKPGTVIIDGTPNNTGNSYPINTNDQNNLIIQDFTLQNSTDTLIWAHGSTSGTVTIRNIIGHTGGNYVLPPASFSAAGQPTINFSSALPPYAVYASNQSVPVQIANSIYVQDATRTATPAYPNNYIVATTSTSITLGNNLTAAVQAGDTIWFTYSSARGIEIVFNPGGNVIAKNNTFDTPSSTQAQTDCEFDGANTGSVTYSNNNCTINNIDPSGHSDCMQQDCEQTLVMDSNYCSHPNGGNNNHGVIGRGTVTGYTWRFTNNVFYMPSGGTAPVEIAAWFDQQSVPGNATCQAQSGQEQGNVQFYNNTIYGGLYGLYINGFSAIDVKNNIFLTPSPNIALYVHTTGFPTANTDYNDIDGLIYTDNYGYQTLSQWQGHGYDTHSLATDPKFVNPGVDGAANYALQPGSPAIDAGTALSVVTTDYSGATRPQGAAYDIGAFELRVPCASGYTQVSVPICMELSPK